MSLSEERQLAHRGSNPAPLVLVSTCLAACADIVDAPGAIDLPEDVFFGCNLDKDQQRMIVSIADFGSESNGGQLLN